MGKRADLAIVDDQQRVACTMRGGGSYFFQRHVRVRTTSEFNGRMMS